MRKLCLMFVMVLSSFVNAQDFDEAFLDNQVEAFSQELKDRGINQLVVYKSYCVGENRIITIKDKVCTSKGTYYRSFVIWKEGEYDYIRKFDICGSFRSVKLSDSSLSDFYESEWSALLDDEVKPYRSETYSGIPERRKDAYPCMREVEFNSENKLVHKKFDLFSLGNESDGKNLNYDFNQTLKLVELHKRIEKVIAKSAFKRER